MPNPRHGPRETKPNAACWHEPDQGYHTPNVDLEPDLEYAMRVTGGAGGFFALAFASLSSALAALLSQAVDGIRGLNAHLAGLRHESVGLDFVYECIEVDLTNAQASVALGLAGNCLTVISTTGIGSLQFNSPTEDLIPFGTTVMPEIYGLDFHEVYVTNAAQVQKNLVLYVGRPA